MVAVDGMEPDWKGAITAVNLAMTPLDDASIEQALAVLEVKTKRRAEADMVADLGLRVFVSELRRYPADVVLEVLRRWPEKSPWAPSWNELYVDLEIMTQKRRDILASLLWSKTKTFRPAEPVKEVSGKSWDNPPDHGMDNPAAPVRDKTDMASQLRSMEAP